MSFVDASEQVVVQIPQLFRDFRIVVPRQPVTDLLGDPPEQDFNGGLDFEIQDADVEHLLSFLARLNQVVPRFEQILAREVRFRIKEVPNQLMVREYWGFVRRCQWLRDAIRDRFGLALTPRQLDSLLLNVAAAS